MSFQLGAQIFGLTIAIAAVLSLIVIVTCERIFKIYFVCKLAYTHMLKREESPDGFKDMLEALAKRQSDGKVGKDL